MTAREFVIVKLLFIITYLMKLDMFPEANKKAGLNEAAILSPERFQNVIFSHLSDNFRMSLLSKN